MAKRNKLRESEMFGMNRRKVISSHGVNPEND